MFNVRLAGGHLYGKQLFTWLSLVVSMMASFVLSFFPLDVLDEIWDLVESVSEGFLTYSFILGYKIARLSSHSLIRYWISNIAIDAKACFSSKVEYRTVIRYLYLKGTTGKEIHGELTDLYGSSAPSYAQVKFWVGDFKRGRTSLEDESQVWTPTGCYRRKNM